MGGFIMLFVCLLGGVLLKRFSVLPSNAHVTLNTFILYVSLPALSLLHIPEIQVSPTLLYPIAVAWIVFLSALALFMVLGRLLGWDKATIGCLTLCCGLCNSSFIGFPIINALYGAKGMETALLVDQPGSFVVLSTLGIITAVYFSSGTPSWAGIGKKLFTFPPLLAFILAVALLLVGFVHTPVTRGVLEPLASTMVPLALVSVGLQLSIKLDGVAWAELGAGLVYKLLLAPFVIYLLYVVLAHQQGMTIQVSVLEAAMAPMITGAILAAQYDLKPKLASLFIGIGIPLSFATLVFWYWLVKGI